MLTAKAFPMCSGNQVQATASKIPEPFNFVPRYHVHTFIQDEEENHVADLPEPLLVRLRLNDLPRVRVHHLASSTQDT